MKQSNVQGNNHKVAGTQEIYKRVAEICSKYGIEFEDEMLTRSSSYKWKLKDNTAFGIDWTFLPFKIELCAPGSDKTFRLRAGMRVYVDNPGTWNPINCSTEDFGENEIAAFNEIAAILI